MVVVTLWSEAPVIHLGRVHTNFAQSPPGTRPGQPPKGVVRASQGFELSLWQPRSMLCRVSGIVPGIRRMENDHV
jgi:hypothetical protein